MKLTVGLCGFCGVALAPDGSRRCGCRPASTIEEAVMRAAAFGRAGEGDALREHASDVRREVQA